MTQQELKHILSSKFDFEKWKDLLGMMFLKIDYLSKPIQIEDKAVKSGGQIGAIRLDDGRSLGLLVFEVADNVNIARNRKGLRDIPINIIDQDAFHGALAFYYSQKHADYRLTFVSKQTSINAEGALETKATAPKRFTFLLGSNEPCTTAANRLMELVNKKKSGSVYLADVNEAFSVERLNKDFFKGYKDQYFKFLDVIGENPKENRDYVKKLLGRLVFLQFLQKKGWMGVPASNTNWQGGNKNYLYDLVKKYEGNDRLLSDVLEVLFFNTLNEKRTNDVANPILGDNIKIPYLNGGLFDKDDLDKKDIDFPYVYFVELMDFFGKYNFTIDENDPDDAEVGVDPEMLGHIFENLLEDNKDKGAFYTPKEIVQYMSEESIAQYLKTHAEEALHPAIEELIKQKKVNEALQNKAIASAVYKLLCDVKVCDPAIGSGAFPMGVLNVLYHSRLLLYGFTKPTQEFSPANVKREIIQNNIYGVDIEQGAVDIARLRFWLALVVDETQPEPLPNLDFKIMQGNSLLEQFEGLNLADLLPKKNEDGMLLIFDEESQLQALLHEKQLRYFSTTDHEEKQTLRKGIVNVVKDLIVERTQGNTSIPDKLKAIDLSANDRFFLWHTWFADVFEEGGFDVVIGNPPYGAKLSQSEKSIYKELYSDVHMRTPETFCYFTSLAFRLCNKLSSAIVSYIVPNNIFFQNENEKTRELLSLENMLVRAINLGDNTFENADVPTCVFIAKAKKEKNYDIAYSDYRDYNIKKIEWDKSIENIRVEKLQTVPAMVIGMSNTDIDILNAIRNNGITIDSIAEEMASGISSGGDKIFKIDVDTVNNHNIEYSILRPVLVGSDINKYSIDYSGDKIIYTTRETNISEYPFTKDYLYQFIDKLSQRSECRKGILPWFALNRNRYERLFIEPKIIMRQTSDAIITTFDSDGYFVLDSILVLKIKDSINYGYKFISSILNSKIVDYLYKKLTQEEGRTFAQVKPINVRKLYVPKASEEEQNLMSILYDYMLYLRNPQKQSVDSVIGNQFIGDFFERIIDGCVFEMFFREHMIERGINVLDFLYDMIKPIENVQEKSETIASVFNTLYKTDNEVRTRMNLFVSRSPEYLKTIIQS